MKTTFTGNKGSVESERLWSNIKQRDLQTYSIDDMIKNFEKGCDIGFAVSIDKMRKELKSKLNETLPIMEKFYNSINEQSHVCKRMFLKVSDIDKFDFIIALEKEQFYDDAICRPIYESSFKVTSECRMIGISFMPFCDNLNYESLKSDNFIAIYGKSE